MRTVLYGIKNKVGNFLESERGSFSLVGLHAAMLTITTLFALVPLMTGVFWLIGQVPEYQTQLYEYLNLILSYMVPDQALVWRSRMNEWAVDIANLQVFSLALFFASIFLLVNKIDQALHAIFQVGFRRGNKRWLHYVWVMPALMAGVVVSMAFVVLLQIVLGTGLASILPGLSLSTVPTMCLLLFVLYRLSSRNTVSNRANLFVSLAVTTAFYVLKTSFGWLYLNLPNWSVVFGFFSAIPLFLLWCQMAWSLLLYGALVLRWLSR